MNSQFSHFALFAVRLVASIMQYLIQILLIKVTLSEMNSFEVNIKIICHVVGGGFFLAVDLCYCEF